mgnify:FL=1
MSDKIVFTFPIKNFYSAYGYAEISVVDGRLELEAEPDGTMLHLIEQYGGKREVAVSQEIKATRRELAETAKPAKGVDV